MYVCMYVSALSLLLRRVRSSAPTIDEDDGEGDDIEETEGVSLNSLDLSSIAPPLDMQVSHVDTPHFGTYVNVARGVDMRENVSCQRLPGLLIVLRTLCSAWLQWIPESEKDLNRWDQEVRLQVICNKS